VGILLDGAASSAPPGSLGGKALGLVELARAGLPVPRWCCLTVDAAESILAQARPEIDAALAPLAGGAVERPTFAAAAARVAAAVRAAGLAPGDSRALREAVTRHLGGATLAVRSSAVGEDAADHSFAGQLDSFLRVGPADAERRVLDVVASAFGERALLYRRLHGLPLAQARVAIVIQEMVEAVRSGVLFTANPTTGDRSEAVVAAARGTGEGVVAGTAEADVLYLDLATGAVRHRAVAGAEPVLSAEEGARVVAGGRRLAELAGAPRDVEWAIDREGALHFLQSRPVTALAEGRESVFDSANIVESYPGVTTPLTFSFVRPAYERTLREASRRFGVPESTLARERAVHANLVALVDGRIYYAILNWYRLYQQLPGFEWTLPAFERALGLPRRWIAPAPPPRGAARVARAWLHLRTWLRLAGLLRRLDGDAQAFSRRLAEARERLDGLALDSLPAHDLLDELDGLTDRLAAPYAVALVNDFFTFQLHAQVERLLVRWRIAGAVEAASLRDALLIGIRGVESLAPLASVAGLARIARGQPALRALLESPAGAEAVWGELQARPEAAPLRAAIARHLERYGDRTLEELKLETPSLAESPAQLVTAIRNALASGADPAQLGSASAAARSEAEGTVARGLFWHPLRRLLFGQIARHWRRGVRRRESLRLARAGGFGLAKRIFRALGRQLAHASLLDAPGDVLWLSVEELDGAVRGHAVTSDLRALVALRREEWGRHGARSPPPRVTVHGIAAAHPRETAPPADAAPGERLAGVGCCPGRARAPARVVLDPRDERVVDGQILVASSTDPGWIFLMVGAAGLVAERGNPLSHTAIVGRELGIPTVVGVAGATRLIADGDLLELDGTAGTVRRLEPASSPPPARER
jgi:pyruvate,water dikinase